MKTSNDIAYWLRIARTDPSKAYCPECSYPLRLTGADPLTDEPLVVCDECDWPLTEVPDPPAGPGLFGDAA